MALPDGPKSPHIWQKLLWIGTPFALMRECRQRYGESFVLAIGQKIPQVVFVSSPKALELILANDDDDIFDAPGELNAAVLPLLGAESVIGLSGERHRRARQLLMPPLHGERMRSYGQLIQEITDEVMSEQGVGKAFSVRKSAQRISLRVILQAVFGLRQGPRYQQLEMLLSTMLDRMGNPFSASFLFLPQLQLDFGPQSPWGRFIRSRQQIDELLYAEIADRRSQTPGDDILSLLLSARDETGAPLSDLELRDELMTLLVAGHETTATAITWALYWIHKLPAVREKLINELQSLGDSTDPNAIFRLPYLTAVCSETIRIYPVGILTFPRITKRSVELDGVTLEPGTPVIGSIYLAHRREQVFPDPENFRPERFLERRYSPYEFLPFGGGSRRCIGMAFAQFEMKLVVARMLSGFELALPDNRAVRLVRRGITSGPSPFQMVVKRRLDGTAARLSSDYVTAGG
ncbi:MAG: cytochrome P450 [Verrucomicrobia bacterium]|nr:cytochrome P450 [Verrucomicrobiota bacterium]